MTLPGNMQTSGSVHPILWKDNNRLAGIKNNYTEIADLLADGLVCLCRSYGDISMKLFHYQLKTPCSSFNTKTGQLTGMAVSCVFL